MNKEDFRELTGVVIWVFIALFVLGGLFFAYDRIYRPLYEQNARLTWEQSTQASDAFYQRFSIAEKAYLEHLNGYNSSGNEAQKNTFKLQMAADKDDMCNAYNQTPSGNSIKETLNKKLSVINVVCK